MYKIICLSLIGLQLVSGISDSSIFKQPLNVISTIFNFLESDFNFNFTQSIRNVDEGGNFPEEQFRFGERNDDLCMEQVNAIVKGLNNSELWAIKCE